MTYKLLRINLLIFILLIISVFALSLFYKTVWGLFIFGGVLQGLRLRFRLAELVQVAAIRSGLQSVGAGQKSK